MSHCFKPGKHLDSWHTEQQFRRITHDGKVLPQVAVAGRSNAGKSSLINCLLGPQCAFVSKTPGKTRAVEVFTCKAKMLWIDLPGYGFARRSAQEREHWGRLIDAYLNSSPDLVGIVIIVDARHPPFALDMAMLEWAESRGIPYLLVLNKWDACNQSTRARVLKDWERWPAANKLRVSCKTATGIDDIEHIVQKWIGDASSQR